MKKKEQRGRGAAGPSISKLESSQTSYGHNETHSNLLDHLLAAEEHEKESKPNYNKRLGLPS